VGPFVIKSTNSSGPERIEKELSKTTKNGKILYSKEVKLLRNFWWALNPVGII